MKALMCVVVLGLLCAALPAVAFGQTLTSDATDYSPGSIATLTGAGFQAGEDVRLIVLHADGQPGDGGADHEPWFVTADDFGGFVTTWHVCEDDCVGEELIATADGLSSGFHAECFFTDSPKVGSVVVGPQSPDPVGPSSTATYTVTVNRGTGGGSSGNFTATLTIATPLPAGTAATFTPNPVTLPSSVNSATSTLRITTSACAPPSGLTLISVKAATSASDFAIGDGTFNATGETTPPVVTLIGNAIMTIQCHSTFSDPGATATDNCAGSLTPVVSGSVNPNAVGDYILTYTATDPSGNSAFVERTVHVVDTTAPTITLIGPNPKIVECHSVLVDPGASASDACDGNLTGQILVTGSVDPNAVGSYVLTYSVSDASGNPATPVNRTVNVVDTTAPTVSLIGPSPMTVECHGSFADPGATATDACDGSLGGPGAAGFVETSAVGSYTLTYSAADAAGNVGSATRTVNVVDTSAPIPDVASLPDVTGECSATIPAAPTATDACAGPIVGTTPNPLTYATQGVHVVTWQFNDGRGNIATQTQSVIVDDVTTPVPDAASLPDVTGECSATIAWPPAATDNCVGAVIGTTSDPLTYSSEGTFIVTWRFDDGNGNIATQTQSVIVDDITAPVPNAASLADVTGECSAAISAPPTATDNCSGSIVGMTSDPLSYSTEGTFTVTWSFEDGHGNVASQIQTVIVDDVTAPVPNVASLPPATGECSVTLTPPLATDNCVGSVAGATSDPLTYSAQGTFLVTWSFDDGNGNVSSQTQTVIVDDVTAPVPDVASLPNVTGECFATIVATPTATDNCEGSIVGTTLDPLSYTAQGTYVVHWSFADGNGNVSSQNQTVIVDDITAPAPDVASLPNVTGECSAAVLSTPTATDNCVGPIVGTTSDPLSYATQGTFVVTWSFDDGNGNVSSQTQTVIVDDVTAPAPDVASLPSVTGECSATAVSTPTATDNCVGPIVGTTSDPLSYATQGTFVVTWTFDDGNGNVSSQTQTVIVDDVTAPVPNVASLANVTGECSATVTAPTATDNCVGPIVGTTSDPLSYSSQGTHVVTWTFDDGNGNVSSQTQTVIVDDVTAPVPNLASLPNVTGECSATATAPTATDNCVGAVVATTSDPLSYATQGTFVVTWTFDDGNGNVSSQSQTVIVDDVTAPAIGTLANVTGQCSATVPVPSASDNCVGPVAGTTSNPLSYTVQGTYTVHWSFNDGNGNVTTRNQTVIVDDTIAPVPNVASLPPVTGACSVTVTTTPTATDNCVGPVTGTTSDTRTYPSQGTYTIHWSYNDGNGNISTQNQSVVVTYGALDGFLPPMAHAPQAIEVKRGRTVPVKFRLTQCAGLATVVANISVDQMANAVDVEAPLEPLGTSSADIGTLFRYSASDDLYIFNLGTSNMTINKTYRIRANLQDGQIVEGFIKVTR